MTDENRRGEQGAGGALRVECWERRQAGQITPVLLDHGVRWQRLAVLLLKDNVLLLQKKRTRQ